MPKCLDCNNTTRFWYIEVSHKLGMYNEDGTLDDVEDDYYDEVQTDTGECAECESKNIEGPL
jgi:hypothetical protein